jgi:thioredoxin-related protein
MQLKPVVDELEDQFSQHLTIIRVNIQEETGRELAQVYGSSFTPTFIFFDGNGEELWREVGGLDPERVRESLE